MKKFRFYINVMQSKVSHFTEKASKGFIKTLKEETFKMAAKWLLVNIWNCRKFLFTIVLSIFGIEN